MRLGSISITVKDNGQEKPALQIFRDHGYNWVRYRLWHTPTQGAQNLEYVITPAQEAKGSRGTTGPVDSSTRAGTRCLS
jgi:arabinogalactan endo-1,4-beta-galactosidase